MFFPPGILACLIVSVMFAEPERDAPIQAELRRDGDQVAISSTKDGGALVAISSKSGIGGVKLKRVGDAWPKALALKINLKGLESLTLTQGDLQLRTALKFADHEGFRRTAGGPWREAKLDAALRPRLKQEGGNISIEIPAVWLDPKQKELAVEWIDFYRG
jgi:hypothetical protein